jgi:hypothetical protein
MTGIPTKIQHKRSSPPRDLQTIEPMSHRVRQFSGHQVKMQLENIKFLHNTIQDDTRVSLNIANVGFSIPNSPKTGL